MNLPQERKHAVPASVAPVPTGAAEGPAIRGYLIAGALAVALAFGGFGSWAALAPLSSAAVAPGAVQVDSNRKTIQHLEGGIISDIFVREGQRVRAGQVVVRLDEVAARADRDMLRLRVLAAAAEEARLTAERDGVDTIPAFDGIVEIHEGDAANLRAVLDEQREIFTRRQSALESEIAVYIRRIEQQRTLRSSAQQQIHSVERQIGLIDEELAAAERLLAEGFEQRPRVLDLGRRLAALEGERTELQGRMDAAAEAIGEAEAQIAALRRRFANEVAMELADARSRRAEADEQARKAGDRLRRVDIVAPQDGTVLGLKYFAPGAVVPPGGAILDLVPEDDALAIEVRVNPLDIDAVHEGLPAQVRLVAFKQRITPTVQGRVTRVSADALLDANTGTAYYLARVELDASDLARVPDAKLYPGMPAEALILTGERTFLDYLLRPILDSFAHAFREQ